MDDHNVYITADSIIKIIDEKIAKSEKRLIVTTHHIGLFSILSERLKYSTHKENHKCKILSIQDTELTLKKHDKDVFLYHLYLFQILQKSVIDKTVMGYHFLLLRQLLEIISSFIGTCGIKKALEEIGYKDNLDKVSNQVNSLSHKDARQQPADLNPLDATLLEEILDKIQKKFNFITH